jgi:chemotaxis protein methyltransferase CheR
MHLILLRNVLIYVDVAVKKTILDKAGRLLVPGGYLLLGGSETTMALDESFEPVALHGAVCFQRRLLK